MEEHLPELVVVSTSSYEQSNFLTGRAEGHEEAHALCNLLIPPLQLGHFFFQWDKPRVPAKYIYKR